MKLTKAELKLHERALEILRRKVLTEEEREFVYGNYHPGATNNITKGAIFFTPPALAWDAAIMHGGCGRIVDACAGIGILCYQHWKMTRFWNPPLPRYVCIEQNEEFVAVGRKLLPEAEWHCGSVFDLLPELGPFDSGLSNPPFGNIPGNRSLNFRNAIHFGILELLLQHTRQGAVVIIPRSDHSQENEGGRKEPSELYKKFVGLYPEALISPCALDMDSYEDFKATGIKVAVCDLSIDGMENPYLETAIHLRLKAQ